MRPGARGAVPGETAGVAHRLPRRPFSPESASLLHGGEAGGLEHGVDDALDQGAVLLALSEDALALRIGREGVEGRVALFVALPGQHVDELVVVAAEEGRPVPHLTEAMLFEGVDREVAEAAHDVRQLAWHRVVL